MHFAVVALRCDTVWPPDCLPRLTDADGRMEGEEEKERRDMILIPERDEGGVRRGYSGVKIYLDTI